MGVKEYGQLQEPPSLLDPLRETGNVGLQLMGNGVDVLRVALPGLSQLRGRRQQLLGVSVGVLKKKRNQRKL